MKRTFIVGMKLLGLLMIYWSSEQLSQFFLILFAALSRLSRSGESRLFAEAWLQGIAVFVSFLFSLAIALAAIFQTQRLARWFGVEADEPLPITLSAAEILHIGMILIGVYVFAHAAPAVVRDLITIHPTGFFKGPISYSHAQLASSVFQLAFAVLLIIRPTTVVRFILKHEAQPPAVGSSD